MQTELAVLKSLHLRSYWKNEAGDFNQWLFRPENLSLLGKEVGLSLSPYRKEFKYKNVRIDLLAIDKSDDSYVLIENQLTSSDYLHMGKILDYIKHINPKTTLWLVQELTNFHVNTIKLIEDQTKLFIIKIELFQIDNSKPAVKFTVLKSPNNWKPSKEEPKQIPFISLQEKRSISKNYLTENLADFLRGYIELGKQYSKNDLLKSFLSFHPSEGELFNRKHSQNFSKALVEWSRRQGIWLNGKTADSKQRNIIKKNGVEYFLFSEPQLQITKKP